MTAIQIEKIVTMISLLLPEVVSLALLVKSLIEESDLSEQTKEELIARIRAAQASVPEWK